MRVVKLIGLSILSGGLLAAAWFPPFTFLIFLGFIPLFFLTQEVEKSTIKRKKLLVFLLSYLAFLVWNICDTWWIWYASESGAVMAICANSLLMALTYLLYFSLQKRFAFTWKIWLLIPVWLSFEYLHNNWDLAWTWLNLGNIFAFQHNWVQWYQFTGVSGGSIWIIAVNILIFNGLKFKMQSPNFRAQLLKVFVVIAFPISVSYFIKSHVLDGTPENPQNVLIVQPNIDPYNDKFNSSYESQLAMVYKQVIHKITAKTNYLILPETFLTENLWENELEQSYSIRFLRDSILKKFPNLHIVTGATTFYRYKKDDVIPATAEAFPNTDIFYDVFNAGIQLDSKGIQLYHKSKLVPGVERMPYPALFKPLEKLTINLGGTSGSLGTQDERTVFFNADKTVGIAPVICYESIFGEFVTGYVKKGANIICIITNDGWWRDTPGYVQHLNYARLRAIETRRQIARSANTGISCVIDELGEIHAAQPWWKSATIMANINPNNKLTFYVRFGDVLSKLAIILLFSAIGYSIFLRFKKQ